MKHARSSWPVIGDILDPVDDWKRDYGCPPEAELDSYRAGGVADEQRRLAIEGHLAKCPVCRAHLNSTPDPARGKRGRSALRAMLRDLDCLFLGIFVWLAIPRRAKAALLLAPVLLPVAIVALTAMATNSQPAKPAGGVPAREAGASQPSVLSAPVEPEPAMAAIWRPASRMPVLFAAEPPQRRALAPLRLPSTVRVLKIGNRAPDEVAGKGETEAVPLPVGRSEMVTVQISNVPRGARAYVAVRRGGGGRWVLSEGVEDPPSNTPFRIDCNFGTQNDDLALFDLRVFLHRENLPPGQVADALLSSRAVVATSPIYRVQRVSLNRPVLGITHINHQEIWEGVIPWVNDESAIQIYASRLPIGAKIGLAVQPVRPLSNDRWIQVDEIAGSGTIDSHWGDPGYHSFVRFAVSSFSVASEKDFPPRGVPIPAAEWAAYSAKFLSISAPVTVVKAGDHFTVEELNGHRLPANGRAITEPQSDISGFLDRPIADGERIWLMCAPGDRNGSKPWIAGSTTDGFDNSWVAKAVQLWKSGQPATFDLLAVLTASDPHQVDPAQLREWANSHPHTINRVTLQAGEARSVARR